MHVPCGDHADLGVFPAECERYVQLAPRIGDAERMKPRLGAAVLDVFDN